MNQSRTFTRYACVAAVVFLLLGFLSLFGVGTYGPSMYGLALYLFGFAILFGLLVWGFARLEKRGLW